MQGVLQIIEHDEDASTIAIHLEVGAEGQLFRIVVTHDGGGVGFGQVKGSDDEPSFELAVLRGRTESVGYSVSIETNLDAGPRITVEGPLPHR